MVVMSRVRALESWGFTGNVHLAQESFLGKQPQISVDRGEAHAGYDRLGQGEDLKGRQRSGLLQDHLADGASLPSVTLHRALLI
jgi:hypothetical protein